MKFLMYSRVLYDRFFKEVVAVESIIYYSNDETDKDKSFYRAAKTNAKETEDPDYFINVTTESDFKEKWERTKRIFEESGDKVSNVEIFTHGGYSHTGGELYFVPDSSNNGVLTYIEIEKLPQLPYTDNATINLHSCNSGVGEDSAAQAFANSQGVPATGTAGYAYFSEDLEHYDRINDRSENVYLEAYDRRLNKIENSGDILPRVTFYPENNDDENPCGQ